MEIDDTTTDIPIEPREDTEFLIDDYFIPDQSIVPNDDDVVTTEEQQEVEEEIVEEIEEIIEKLEYSGESL